MAADFVQVDCVLFNDDVSKKVAPVNNGELRLQFRGHEHLSLAAYVCCSHVRQKEDFSPMCFAIFEGRILGESHFAYYSGSSALSPVALPVLACFGAHWLSAVYTRS